MVEIISDLYNTISKTDVLNKILCISMLNLILTFI